MSTLESTPTRLTSKEYWVIGIVLAVSAISLAVSVKYFSSAFPEASIDFKVNREESAALAEKFLADRGFGLDGYRHASIFSYDDTAKLYLERTQGLDRMSQLTGTAGPISLWRWSHRWFKSQEKEELRAEVTPAGVIAGFRHELPESAPGATIEPAAARLVAEEFLSKTLGPDFAGLEFLDAAREVRPARVDHTFTWTDKSVSLGDGSQRVQVDISGDRVSGYREYVHVPEQWTREYQELRSRNNSAQIVDEVFWILLTVAMLIVLVIRLRHRDAPVRLALGFGVVAVALVFLGVLNSFSLAQFDYPTTTTYSGFVSNYLMSGALSAILLGVTIFVMVAASEPIYRESFPKLASIGRTLTWRGLRSRSFFMANVVGLGLTFFFVAYQTVFYLLANRLGAWAPMDVPFSDLINTSIPWVAVLLGGFAPAVMEEIQFRAFAIPFLHRVLRFWPLAIVLSAFNWGFLHSAYPNEPFFIRGLEVGVGGIIIGVIMLRFGVVATMIWHYSVDAVYTAFILLRSSSPYFVVSGALTGGIMLVPLVIALVAYWRTGTFSDESSLTNEAEGTRRLPPQEAPAAEPVTTVSYDPLASRRLALAGMLAVILAAVALVPVDYFGKGVTIGITQDRAIEVAGNFLSERGIAYKDYSNVARLFQNVDASAVQYLFERSSVEDADRIYKLATRLLLWEVRYFRPLEKEEHRVIVDASNGEVFGYQRLLDEDAPGASLTIDQARKVAESTVSANGYALSDFEFQDSQTQKRKGRQDYTLTWQAKAGDPRNVADAKYRIQVDIAGDQVTGFSRSFKLPEDWERRRDSSGIGNTVLTGLLLLLGAGILAGIVMLFLQEVRRGRIRWFASGKVAFAFAVLAAINELSQLAMIDRGYNTSISLSIFHITAAVGIFIRPLFIGLIMWIVVSLVTSLYPEAWNIFNPDVRRRWRRDAIVVAALAVAASAAVDRVSGLITNWFHATAASAIGTQIVPAGFDSSIPGLTIFLQSMISAMLLAGLAATLFYGIERGWRNRAWWLWVGMGLGLVAMGPTDAHSLSEYFTGWGISIIPVVLGLIIVVTFFRNNAAAVLTAAICLSIFEPAVALFSQPLAFYKWNGGLLLALTSVVLVWLLRPLGGRQPQT